ncbi:MAG: guanine deaminase [Acidimicrobiia bacterium]|nr:guanine deaminase [Acidimicrobiia bacterium]
MTSSPGVRGVVGPILDAPAPGELRYRRDALVVVDGSGSIEDVLEPADPRYDPIHDELRASGDIEVLPPGTYLLPGLIDLHNHAPQWPQLGKALDVPLEVWLNEYTFPLEARYSSTSFAQNVYRSLVATLLANGTTTAVYFGTIHVPATQLLVDECLVQGQRAVVGKVAMDHPEGCPDYYRDDSVEAALSATARFIEYVRDHPDNRPGLVQAAVTPRFVPSCTDELLAGLGELARAEATLVQTHCSESDWAHGYGLDRYDRTDTETYAEFGLLRRGTVLAHSNFITETDMGLIRDAGSAVAHCPLSNVYFANAVFPVRRALASGIHVGLGTDVSGGPSPSVFNAAANAVAVSRVLEDGVDAAVSAADRGVAGSRISFAEAFWLATTGGGEALGLPIGLLEPGYQFDAIAVATDRVGANLSVWPELDSTPDVLQKIINNCASADITSVWVAGRKVKPAG